jgi:phosphatidylserine/phosphatidylglycerophosphate/cardiolipin synthase-like enzyme
VLSSIREAKERGADVKIVFDDIGKRGGPWRKNEKQISVARLKSICSGRENGTLMHNKFLVLSENGEAQAVLFGSTSDFP